ncbi:CDP-diglyceride synthetase [Vibrio rotiferianus]|uniref:Phosphatidate cytidylyltransferase n=1 Tax=Vibrio rotiferianus TaxID=190895 RepID=A0A510I8U5_9VIBR|nr:phosphatidate cytidylyltransferase [Vibrio rotiferianus]NOH66436.1 CDP-diglyceride synthetase [Vibrio rotiferianus]TMX32837.1 CDP-diglyceride synthetase [Vibrio rotiferianus]TMX52861.1 CDP-diglyceride synthetase [Vibrio rotiferianus]TMX58879.1 CDP-diglyceride synthetase [Vibrio rotiferianus]TMX71926.1 CDP-diglyceride synthetase [Vibrio rotiferianus]
MKQRIITALILAPLVILGIFKLPLIGFIIALTAVTLLGFWEWTQFTESNSRIAALIPAAVVTGLSFLFISPDVTSLNQLAAPHYAVLALGFAWWIIASGMAITYPKTTNLWQGSKALRHVFGFLTLIPFLWSVIILRASDISVDPYHGAKLVLYVCFLVWAADSGAYFAGKSMGKRKMAPHVSPNKTIEGLIGGIIAALIVGWLFAGWFDIQFTSPLHMVIITLITVVISVLGDLVESMFKRVSGIKDSSNIIPGHGGILDRIDSLTAAFPVFALLYYVF